MTPSNFHTHTVYCDGKNTPRELIETALSLGCPSIGFSGHSYTAFDDSFCMTKEGTEAYFGELAALKAEYAGRIAVYVGLEQDYYSDRPVLPCDYIIGSVHYLYKDGRYLPVDMSAALQAEAVERHYGGDWYAFAEHYYALMADLYDKTHCTVVGHFDLVTKFNEGDRLFDTTHPRYVAAADAALDALLEKGCVFEINTGAIVRGYRTKPYPEERLRARIRSAGGRLLWTSDCHDRSKLLFGLPDGPNELF
ncbi:MAG: histidinol-phosphatase HisJ family protein [Eubacteriales bacterium]|nr:histidinol-phosphatase HisJ family protein [Eubacteriales bacterium]